MSVKYKNIEFETVDELLEFRAKDLERFKGIAGYLKKEEPEMDFKLESITTPKKITNGRGKSKKANKMNQKWSLKDLKFLRKATSDKVKTNKIALALGRSVNSVKATIYWLKTSSWEQIERDRS